MAVNIASSPRTIESVTSRSGRKPCYAALRICEVNDLARLAVLNVNSDLHPCGFRSAAKLQEIGDALRGSSVGTGCLERRRRYSFSRCERVQGRGPARRRPGLAR